MTSPFHAYEIAVQDRLGVRDIESWAQKVIRDHMPLQHRDFYGKLPFIIIAARDKLGRPWVTLLDGPTGFVTSPNNKTLSLKTEIGQGDALYSSLSIDSDIGILGIEPATKRRNRVNGRIGGFTKDEIVFKVDQSFGNCPQYIHPKSFHRIKTMEQPSSFKRQSLSEEQVSFIRNSDTFFIGSGYRGQDEQKNYGMDASHRGGPSGFVQVMDANTIRFPDYSGNNHFNTIGNIMADPRVGLVFIDFQSGDLLQITGRAEIDWDSPDLKAFPDARRLITVRIEEVIEQRHQISWRMRGDLAKTHTLVIKEKIKESDDVLSLMLAHPQGASLPPFQAGQHLPVHISDPNSSQDITRHYSLSNAPNSKAYRISVKREKGGLASNHLHDQLPVGSQLKIGEPAGDFTLRQSNSPLVLISAGVGITPMMSMLLATLNRMENRSIYFFHGARNGSNHSFKSQLDQYAKTHSSLNYFVHYSVPDPEDVIGRDYDYEGRLTGDDILKHAPKSADFYICGPQSFMADINDSLIRNGVSEAHTHQECFQG